METDLNKLRDRAYKCACRHGFHDKEYSDTLVNVGPYRDKQSRRMQIEKDCLVLQNILLRKKILKNCGPKQKDMKENMKFLAQEE